MSFIIITLKTDANNSIMTIMPVFFLSTQRKYVLMDFKFLMQFSLAKFPA